MKLLITAAGSGTAFAYALTVSKFFPDIELYTADSNIEKYVTSSLFAKKHIQTSNFEEHKFLNQVNGIISEYNIDSYIPFIDPEIYFCANNVQNIKSNVVVNNQEFCKAAVFKNLYPSLVEGSDITAPKTLDFVDFERSSLAVAKKNFSFGGRTIIVKSPDNPMLEADFSEDWYFYEFVEGEEYTIDCFPIVDENKIITSVRKRTETKSGVSTKTQMLIDPQLDEFAKFLLNKYKPIHPFCFQTRKKNNVHYLFDLNPRLGGGTSMSALNGMNFQAAHLNLLVGKDPNEFLNRKYQECMVTRQYTDYLMEVKK